MVGKTWVMHKRALQGLKRSFMHVSSFPLHILTNYFSNWIFKIKLWWGKTRDVCFRAWNVLYELYACLRSSLSIFWCKKNKNFIYGFLSKYDEVRPEACIKVRFRPWNAHLCISQVFPHHVLIKNYFMKYLAF